jgi:hypothetical protein
MSERAAKRARKRERKLAEQVVAEARANGNTTVKDMKIHLYVGIISENPERPPYSESTALPGPPPQKMQRVSINPAVKTQLTIGFSILTSR